MKSTFKRSLLAFAVAAAVAPMTANATNGYFAHGYGIKAKGMAGVGIALPQDALAAATNPAGMVEVGNRVDFGAEIFRPDREGRTLYGPNSGSWYDGNDTEAFLIPEFGYNQMLNNNMSLGVSVFGNGGMNTDYSAGIYSSNPLGLNDQTGTGVDLMQLFISPTLGWKINERHSVGVSLNLAYQRFEATGLSDFCGFTAPGGPAGCADGVTGLSDQGYDDSYGWGVRIGWIGKITDTVTLGATYQSKTRMSEFDEYNQLFAEQGDFDIPSNYGVGIAVQATPQLTVAFDYMRINYSDVNSIANPNNGWTGGILGTDNGPGFGWDDINVYKLGFAYQVNDNLTLRAGWNHGDQPIPTSQTQFNIIAPGVIEDHVTLGATWTLRNGGELSAYYMHAFENEVNGTAPTNPMDAGHGDLKMSQDAIGVAYGWSF